MPVDSIRRSPVPSPAPPADAPPSQGPDAARHRHAPAPQLSAGARHVLARHAARAGRVALATPSPARIAERLDEFLRDMQGPYVVGGQQVRVAADFRMQGGLNQLSRQVYEARIAKALGPKEYARLARDVAMVTEGKGTPQAIRRVTQALIDSPAFAKYAPLPPERAVRHLMWNYGIGADCSGYVHNAFLYSRGTAMGRAAPAARYALGTADNSGLQHLPGRAFRRVGPEHARPGDVIVLTHGPDGTGHKLIVYSRRSIAPSSPAYAACAKALGGPAGAHIDFIEVDSSWGAGGNPDDGGVGRRSWAYDESTHRWASVYKDGNGLHAVRSSKSGPYDHDLQGIYRPRWEK